MYYIAACFSSFRFDNFGVNERIEKIVEREEMPWSDSAHCIMLSLC